MFLELKSRQNVLSYCTGMPLSHSLMLSTCRDSGLLGGFDLSRCDIISELLEALEEGQLQG